MVVVFFVHQVCRQGQLAGAIWCENSMNIGVYPSLGTQQCDQGYREINLSWFVGGWNRFGYEWCVVREG